MEIRHMPRFVLMSGRAEYEKPSLHGIRKLHDKAAFKPHSTLRD